MIDKTKIFPLLLIILDLGAAVMFVPRKDWGNIILVSRSDIKYRCNFFDVVQLRR